MMYKQWLDNEYRLWIEALQSSTVHNFKEHPMVKRMLGEIDWPKEFRVDLSLQELELIAEIDNIGRDRSTEISGACWRMVYYACQVLQRDPLSIIEIGGGVGQFYAVMRALGYNGDYSIADAPEVALFQIRYLAEVEWQTGLRLHQKINYEDMYECFCVSFYALGEFDDELKAWYVENVVKKCPHGFIVWNPHSGASSEIPFECKISDEYPLLNPGNKQLEW